MSLGSVTHGQGWTPGWFSSCLPDLDHQVSLCLFPWFLPWWVTLPVSLLPCGQSDLFSMSPSWLKFSSGSPCNKMWTPGSWPCSAVLPAAFHGPPSVQLVAILQRCCALLSPQPRDWLFLLSGKRPLLLRHPSLPGPQNLALSFLN